MFTISDCRVENASATSVTEAEVMYEIRASDGAPGTSRARVSRWRDETPARALLEAMNGGAGLPTWRRTWSLALVVLGGAEEAAKAGTAGAGAPATAAAAAALSSS